MFLCALCIEINLSIYIILHVSAHGQSLKMLGLYCRTLKIGHKFGSMINIRNELTLLTRIAKNVSIMHET